MGSNNFMLWFLGVMVVLLSVITQFQLYDFRNDAETLRGRICELEYQQKDAEPQPQIMVRNVNGDKELVQFFVDTAHEKGINILIADSDFTGGGIRIGGSVSFMGERAKNTKLETEQ